LAHELPLVPALLHSLFNPVEFADLGVAGTHRLTTTTFNPVGFVTREARHE